MKKRIPLIAAALVLVVLAAVFILNFGKATSMHLVHTEGQVQVQDKEGQQLPIRTDLSLYDGHEVDTEAESYAWIDLDKVKLTKMDQSSSVTIHKTGKKLEMVVNSGSLFFNVTEPLEEDETMEIRSSTMLVGIRGTCGWVELVQENCMRLYLLEGEVLCTVRDEAGRDLVRQTVFPGQMAELVYDEENSSITVGEIEEIPEFVAVELEEGPDSEETGTSGPSSPSTSAGVQLIDPETRRNDPATVEVMNQYSAVLQHAYDYFPDYDYNRSLGCRYAILQLEQEDRYPTLLLEFPVSSEYNNLDLMRIFQYDPDTGVMHQTEEFISTATAIDNYYIYSIYLLPSDRQGLMSVTYGHFTDMPHFERIRLDGDTLIKAPMTYEEASGNTLISTQYMVEENGILTQPTAEELWNVWIENTQIPSDEIPSHEVPEEFVFSGIIGSYTYEEVLEMQDITESEPIEFYRNYFASLDITYRTDRPYLLIVLQPGLPLYRTNVTWSVAMIDVSDAPELAQYEGMWLDFSVDVADITFPDPDDCSLPVGQPRASNIRILGVHDPQ